MALSLPSAARSGLATRRWSSVWVATPICVTLASFRRGRGDLRSLPGVPGNDIGGDWISDQYLDYIWRSQQVPRAARLAC
jgi:hypothetical protein